MQLLKLNINDGSPAYVCLHACISQWFQVSGTSFKRLTLHGPHLCLWNSIVIPLVAVFKTYMGSFQSIYMRVRASHIFSPTLTIPFRTHNHSDVIVYSEGVTFLLGCIFELFQLCPINVILFLNA